MNFGYAVARAYAGHTDSGSDTSATSTYVLASLHLNTTITLPVGVEAYAAYALHAWLAREDSISAGTRRFAK